MTEPQTPHTLYEGIRDVLAQARGKALRAVNSAMLDAYWHVGRLLVEEDQKGSLRAE